MKLDHSATELKPISVVIRRAGAQTRVAQGIFKVTDMDGYPDTGWEVKETAGQAGYSRQVNRDWTCKSPNENLLNFHKNSSSPLGVMELDLCTMMPSLLHKGRITELCPNENGKDHFPLCVLCTSDYKPILEKAKSMRKEEISKILDIKSAEILLDRNRNSCGVNFEFYFVREDLLRSPTELRVDLCGIDFELNSIFRSTYDCRKFQSAPLCWRESGRITRRNTFPDHENIACADTTFSINHELLPNIRSGDFLLWPQSKSKTSEIFSGCKWQAEEPIRSSDNLPGQGLNVPHLISLHGIRPKPAKRKFWPGWSPPADEHRNQQWESAFLSRFRPIAARVVVMDINEVRRRLATGALVDPDIEDSHFQCGNKSGSLISKWTVKTFTDLPKAK